MSPPNKLSPLRGTRSASRAAAFLALLLCAGCASNRYHAARLPVHLQAPAIVSPQSTDLTRLAMVPSGTNQIDAGDLLDVTVSAGLNASDTFTVASRVSERGTANLPLIGDVTLAGLTLTEAEDAISATAVERGIYRAPQITVGMKKKQSNRVMVVGAVKTPGVYELPRRSSDLVAALIASGGLAENAGPNVAIRNPSQSTPGSAKLASSEGDENGFSEGNPFGRVEPAHQFTDRARGKEIVQVNLVADAGSPKAANGYYVEDGGVITVEKKVPAPLHVFGLVHKPGRYDFPLTQDVRMLDALSLAGGTSIMVADKVYIIRRLPDQKEPALIQASIREAKRDGAANPRLAEGDIITVEQTPATALIEAIRILRVGVGASLGTLF